MRRGQTLSYDAIGAAVIFMVAVGLLAVGWVSSTPPENAELIDMAQKGLERLVEDQLIEEGYKLNLPKDCKDIDFIAAGVVLDYNFTVIDSKGKVLYDCSSISGNKDVKGVAERIYYLDDTPVKVRLEVFNK